MMWSSIKYLLTGAMAIEEVDNPKEAEAEGIKEPDFWAKEQTEQSTSS